MALTDAQIIKRLEKPNGRKIDVVLDTDTFNEIDDQYAIAYILKHSEKFNLQAIYAAPFSNVKAATPKIGMEKSYDEIMNILTFMGRDDVKEIVYKGSEAYLPDEVTPVDSPAARDMVERIMARPDDDPLYVIAIGAITNVASALIMEPKIAEKCVIVWLGGHSLEWYNTREFNMVQDIAGARVLFNSRTPLVLLPCMGVVSALATTGPELNYWLKGKNALCDYLCDITVKEANDFNQGEFWSRAIWDVSAVAWLLDDPEEKEFVPNNFFALLDDPMNLNMGDKMMLDRLEPAPLPAYDGTWSIAKNRHPIKYVYAVKRDLIFEDLFTRLAQND